MKKPRPKPGRSLMLVYGECECGWWMATHEGGAWPHCPLCGIQVWPTRKSHGDNLGFLAVFGDEIRAVQFATHSRYTREEAKQDG